MLSSLLPSSESDSDQEADSSQRGVEAGDEVGGEDDQKAVTTPHEKRDLGAVRPARGVLT